MTKNEIKAAILATKPSRTYFLNDEEFELTDDEFDKAINDRVEMEYAQHLHAVALAKAEADKLALLEKLGISQDEANLLLNG